MTRRFLIGYAYPTGWGSIYHTRTEGTLPSPRDLRGVRLDVARSVHCAASEVVILAVSEISSEGEAEA